MELALTDLIVAVVFSSMAVVLIFSILASILRQRSQARAISRTLVCRLCLHAYQSEQGAQGGRISECPQCGARNERGYHQGPR